MALYRGDLLEGFYLSGCPEFEQWLETERAELRTLAAKATWQLVDSQETEGRLDDAISWARKGILLEGRREPGVRRLLTLLAMAGQRGAAIGEFEDFARYLDQEYDLEPSQETVDLFEAIRQGADLVDGFGISPPDERRIRVNRRCR